MLLLILLLFFTILFSGCRSQHGKIDGAIVASSYLNPLANIKGAPILSTGVVEAEYIEVLSEPLHFTYTVKPPKDILAVGVLLPNGSWTGCMGQLQRKEVDVVISMMTMTPIKYAVAEPSTPMYFEETVIVIPYWGHKSDTNITSPLSPGSWAVLLASFFLAVISIIIAQRELKHSISFWPLSIVSVFAAHRFPLYGKENNYNSRLIVTGCLLGVGVLLRTYYIAEITAMVATPNPSYLFKSIEEVAEESKHIKVMVAKGSTSEEYFMTSQIPAIKKLGEELRRHPERLFHYEKDLKKIYDSIDETTILIQPKLVAEGMIYKDYIAHNKHCRYTLAPEGFNPKAQGMAFPKDSPYTADFTGEILDELRYGLPDYFKRKVTRNTRQPCTTLKDEEISDLLVMTNLVGAFYLLLTGYSLAILVFLVDLLIFNCKKHRLELKKEEITIEDDAVQQ